ncbi:MAG: hypothetical protein J4O01_11640 [Chloroflexi bacterium]|nr:hypothetical protein [Chloroflexota bacterium]
MQRDDEGWRGGRQESDGPFDPFDPFDKLRAGKLRADKLRAGKLRPNVAG